MPEQRAGPHAAVIRELLVRYLDTWTPLVLRAHRTATYIDAGNADLASAAIRVFGEFTDRLAGHQLDVVMLAPSTPLTGPDPPPGLTLRPVRHLTDITVTGPALAHLDIDTGTVDEAAAWQLVAALTPGKAREILFTLPPTAPGHVLKHRARLHAAGLTQAVTVELVDNQQHARLLIFATAAPKHLTLFKDELWAADEFAGIRYRDPHDPDHTLIDIAINPQLLPLRHALLTELARRGSCTAAELQHHTEQHTIYRPADTLRALTAAAAAGHITREPAKGRKAPRTIVRRHE